MKKMRVCVVTGTRAEFGIWRPVLRAIVGSRLLELKLVVTGMHLLEEFGNTVGDIEEEGFEIAERVPMFGGGWGTRAANKPPKGGTTNSRSLARGIEGFRSRMCMAGRRRRGFGMNRYGMRSPKWRIFISVRQKRRGRGLCGWGNRRSGCMWSGLRRWTKRCGFMRRIGRTAC